MLNPMAGIVAMQRECILYREVPLLGDVVSAGIFAVGLLLIGYVIFVGLEPRFAEEI